MARSSLRAVVLLIVTVALSVWVYGRLLSEQPESLDSAATAPRAHLIRRCACSCAHGSPSPSR
jgi:hypothetical protein